MSDEGKGRIQQYVANALDKALRGRRLRIVGAARDILMTPDQETDVVGRPLPVNPEAVAALKERLAQGHTGAPRHAHCAMLSDSKAHTLTQAPQPRNSIAQNARAAVLQHSWGCGGAVCRAISRDPAELGRRGPGRACLGNRWDFPLRHTHFVMHLCTPPLLLPQSTGRKGVR